MDNNIKVVLTNGTAKYYNNDVEYDSLEEAISMSNKPDFTTVRTDMIIRLYKEASKLEKDKKMENSLRSYNRGIMYAIERILPNVDTLAK
jgi:hypothetical protein